MPTDSVRVASGPLDVATSRDADGFQHQRVLNEFLFGNSAIAAGTSAPLPIESNPVVELLMAMLVEIRVQNTLISALTSAIEAEPVEALRQVYKTYPVTM